MNNNGERTFIEVKPLAEYRPQAKKISEGNLEYELQEPSSLRLEDIGKNDRAFVDTMSGNEFMIRYSEKINAYKIYSRAHSMFAGRELRDVTALPALRADIGKPMVFFVPNPEDDSKVVDWITSAVEKITIIKDIDEDANNKRLMHIGGLK